MKKYIILFAALACLCACENELAPDETCAGLVRTSLQASLPGMTRTSVDGVKMSWSAGDEITVNGSRSYALTEAGASAVFDFADDLALPYRAVYPASMWKNDTQLVIPDSFDASLTQIPLWGYASTGNQIGFSALTAVFRVPLTGNGETLRKATLTALGGQALSGTFSIDFSSGKITPVAGKNTVGLNCDATLGQEPLLLYLPVPEGDYPDGFRLDLEDAGGNILSRSIGARTCVAGQLRAMPALAWELAPGVPGIASAADFAAFAAAVNSGASTKQWENDEGVVTLLGDIDFSGVTSWTPVGAGVSTWASNALTVSGQPFTGHFNGCGHTLRNFAFTYAASGSEITKDSNQSVPCGIFGILGPGAIVENFVIDASCSFSFSPTVRSDAGIVAGLVQEATVRNITNHASMTLDNKAEDEVRETMAMLGFAFSGEGETIIEGLVNEGKISASTGNNTKNGATGVQVAGILGFSTNAAGSSQIVHVRHCTNYGELETTVCRSAGIVAAANRYTLIESCENHGDNHNAFTVSGGGRIANITCITGDGSALVGCVNYADVICATKARAGGVVSLVNNKNNRFENCANYGRVITDETTYRGTFFQQCNLAASFKACIAAGDVGSYNGGSYQMVGVNANNYFDYVGYHNSSATNVTAGNIIYTDAPEWTGINSIEDLLAFAQAVNSGGSLAQWQSGGTVQILRDIDASSVSEWVPIGTDQRALSCDIDGMGHRIYGVNWRVDAEKYPHAGLFGNANNVSISNLVFGDSNSRVVFYGNPAKLRAGGIVGYAKGVTMHSVTNNADLSVEGSSAQGNGLIIGGLAGYNSPESTIGGSDADACTNNGDVIVPLACQQGGLAGYSTGVVSYCVNNGAIIGRFDGNYGPAWGCCYNKTAASFTSNTGNGRVGDYDTYAGNPQQAPVSNFYNAVRQDYTNCFKPEENSVDWTADSYYDWDVLESRTLAAGAVYRHCKFKNVPRHMHVLEVDLTNPAVEVTTALADDIIPNPNGRDNDHLYAGFVLRETLSKLCTRKRNAGDNIIAGINLGFFDSAAGILRGFHVENGEPLYINNPSVVTSLSNHRWGLTVFADGSASCGKKVFTGTLRHAGTEYPYYSINDTTLRHASPAVAPVNLYTSRYVKLPHPSNTKLVNSLASNVLYVVCKYDDSPMKVNCGYYSATVQSIYDGRKQLLSSLPYLTSADQVGIALSGTVADSWASSVKVGDIVELRCDISIEGDASKPIAAQGSTMYEIMKDGNDRTSSIGSSSALHLRYDPMTWPVVSEDGRKLWLVLVDGRQGWYSMGLKAYEIYRISKKLGGSSATRFDGGGSTTMWLWNPSSGQGSVVNRPSDSNGERSCMSYLLIRAK
ncbi:MAG: phosphodiester glycosidase family protein [Bacteroidales bacterium]|nr:phosphodiester glycosidase family protein [Bacteroidales bacterium]